MDLILDSSFSLHYCCRTCMKTNSLLLNIFDGGVNNISMAEVLMICTSVIVSNNDSLPKSICQDCYDKLNSFYKFRISVEKNDSKFREMMEVKPNLSKECNMNGKKPLDEIKIENEVTHCQRVSIKEENVVAEISAIDTDNKVFLFVDNTNTEPKSIDSKNKTQNNYSNYDCKICTKKFRSLSNYQRHTKKHLNNNSTELTSALEKDIKCPVCASFFESSGSLMSHMKVHSNGKSLTCNINEIQKTIESFNDKETSNDEFKCEICKGQFRNKHSLSAHMRKHAKKGRILACSICGKIFNKISHLKRHEYSHEDKCPFKCRMCRKSYATQEMLQEHIKHHNDIKPHVCPVCKKAFFNMAALNTHIKIHTRDKLYLCPTCGKRFDSSTNLNQHVKRHTGIKAFACPLCPKKFVSKGEMKSHGITHTGEKSYKCKQCNATFTKHSSLVQHNLRHLGVKPHQCDTCPMKFTSRSHLKRHYRIHTGEKPYRCDLCERAFTQSNDLVKHSRGHLGDKIYKCNECTESFRLKNELRAHVSHHYVTHARTHAADQGGVANVTKGDLITNQLVEHLNCNKEE